MLDDPKSRLKPVPPCLLPVNNPSLESEHYSGGAGVDPSALCALRGTVGHTRGGTLWPCQRSARATLRVP